MPLPCAHLISLLMHYLSVLSFKLFDVKACELKLSFIFWAALRLSTFASLAALDSWKSILFKWKRWVVRLLAKEWAQWRAMLATLVSQSLKTKAHLRMRLSRFALLRHAFLDALLRSGWDELFCWAISSACFWLQWRLVLPRSPIRWSIAHG